MTADDFRKLADAYYLVAADARRQETRFRLVADCCEQSGDAASERAMKLADLERPTDSAGEGR